MKYVLVFIITLLIVFGSLTLVTKYSYGPDSANASLALPTASMTGTESSSDYISRNDVDQSSRNIESTVSITEQNPDYILKTGSPVFPVSLMAINEVNSDDKSLSNVNQSSKILIFRGSSSSGSSTSGGSSSGGSSSGSSSSGGSSSGGSSSGSSSSGDSSSSGGGSASSGSSIATGIILMSKLHLKGGMKDESQEKTEKFLSFFRTPNQQFIPLGFYAMADDMTNIEKLKSLREHGINLFHRYSSSQSVSRARNDLQAAKNAGVAVMQNLPRKHLKTPNQRFWQDHISGIVNDKQLLVWYLPEETDPDDLQYLRRIEKIIRQKDLSHRPIITYVENYVPGYWEGVSQIVDALALGIYPAMLPNGVRADVRRAIDKAYSVGVPVVISALEAWGYKGTITTPKQARFDAYLALISGSKGLLWYSYHEASKYPELMQAVLEIATELNGPDKLGEVILKGKTPSNIKSRLICGSAYAPPACAYENRNREIKIVYSSLQWTAREHDGYLYIFAVNMNQKLNKNINAAAEYEIEVAFENITASAREAEVMFESRKIPIFNGKILDVFESIGTHIYKIKLN